MSFSDFHQNPRANLSYHNGYIYQNTQFIKNNFYQYPREHSVTYQTTQTECLVCFEEKICYVVSCCNKNFCLNCISHPTIKKCPHCRQKFCNYLHHLKKI